MILERRTRSIELALLPVISTTLFYLLFSTFNGLVLRVRNEYVGDQPLTWHFKSYWLNVHGGLIYDFGIHLFIGYFLYLAIRSRHTFILIQFILIGAIYVGGALKISILGSPVEPLDISSIPEVLSILGLDGWIVYTTSIILIGLLIWSIKPTRLTRVSMLATAFFVALLFNAFSGRVVNYLDVSFDVKPWDRRFNHDGLGTTAYLLKELAILHMNREIIPDAELVSDIIASNKSESPAPYHLAPGNNNRNVYMILAESLWDPQRLVNAGFNDDPFDSSFRKLWNVNGKGMLLSPVFGGRTAEAEYEALCGHPVSGSGITFDRGIFSAELPCLPRLLADQGYHAIAIHPNAPGFFNRQKSYGQLGFKEFISSRGSSFYDSESRLAEFDASKKLQPDDLNGAYLSNQSLFAQTMRIIERLREPYFVYVLTISGHWPYQLSESRTREISATSDIDDVENYANVTRHNTRELFGFFEKLQEQDPSALILVAGDHLPSLHGLAGYQESNLHVSDGSTNSDNMFNAYATPMVLRNGPFKPRRLVSP